MNAEKGERGSKPTDAGTGHFIAVNCHPYHQECHIKAALQSLATAMATFRACTLSRTSVYLFWHNPKPPPRSLVENCLAKQIACVHLPHASNGENLNAQIRYAHGLGFAFFYRVDGDDTVYEHRFVKQSAILTRGVCDLCGAALRYEAEDDVAYANQPPERPSARAFLENRYLLHPTMAFSLAAFSRTGLQYWSRRLEDKALLSDAAQRGLRIQNIPYVAGTYRLQSGTRERFAAKWLALQLNVVFLWRIGAIQFVPYALALFVGQTLLGSRKMRKIRHLIYRRKPEGHRSETAKTSVWT